MARGSMVNRVNLGSMGKRRQRTDHSMGLDRVKFIRHSSISFSVRVLWLLLTLALAVGRQDVARVLDFKTSPKDRLLDLAIEENRRG